jgi:hypothetical protein
VAKQRSLSCWLWTAPKRALSKAYRCGGTKRPINSDSPQCYTRTCRATSGVSIAILEGMMSSRISKQDDTANSRSGVMAQNPQFLDHYGSRRESRMRGVTARPELRIEIDRWENEGGRVASPVISDE